jgi:hypothetical protein
MPAGLRSPTRDETTPRTATTPARRLDDPVRWFASNDYAARVRVIAAKPA